MTEEVVLGFDTSTYVPNTILNFGDVPSNTTGSIPLTTVTSRIIQLADGGNISCQDALRRLVYDKFNLGGYNQILDDSLNITPTGTSFVPIDISGQSGTHLTISKNGGPWVTFNLGDPAFDVVVFQNMVILGQSNTSFAFLDWPSPISPDELRYDRTPGICGINEFGRLMAPGQPDGYELVDGIYVDPIDIYPPFNVTPEVNTIRIMQTDSAPVGMDLFFTIPGAVAGGIMTVTSVAVINFT